MALFFQKLGKVFVPRAARASQRTRQTPPCPRFRAGRGYVLVVDESGSTGSAFRVACAQTTTRIAAIREAAYKYLWHLRAGNPSQQVALVGFSDVARLHHGLAPVGRAFQGLLRAVGSLRPRDSTDLSAGLTLAMEQLSKSCLAQRTIVVITDGAANRGRERLPGVIKRAVSMGVRIFTIGVGNNADTDYDRALLVEMARVTGGRFASAHRFEHLCQALQRVA